MSVRNKHFEISKPGFLEAMCPKRSILGDLWHTS